jgi:hypothetical protein
MKTPKPKQPISSESIARLADKGRDISHFFTNKGKMMPPLETEVDLSEETNDELEGTAMLKREMDSPL